MFAVLRLASYALANDNGKVTGRLEGTVFVGDDGHQSYTAGAKVLASGPIKIETETTADGKYVFVALPPGSYTVTVTYSGLEVGETVTVEANQIAQVPLQLKPPTVKTVVQSRPVRWTPGLPPQQKPSTRRQYVTRPT